MQKIEKTAVLGTGIMGRQIAVLCAMHGFPTALYSRSADGAAAARRWAGDYLDGRVKKGRLSVEEAEAAKNRLLVSFDPAEALDGAGWVIEAAAENIDVKRSLFRQIGNMVSAEALLCTNSSNICSSRLADCVPEPERLCNLHFLNPALVMELVEIVGGAHTAPETLQRAAELAGRVGKTPIILHKEVDGFAVNRINAAITCEACRLVEQGILSPEEVDLACEKGLKFPMGPFRLMDLVGLDVHCDIRNDRYRRSGNPADAPNPIVLAKVARGETGRKTGRGWYEYPDQDRR